MRRIGTVARRWWGYVRDTKAVSALEYAILVGVIAVAIAAALGTFSGNIDTAMKTIGDDVGALAGAGAPDLAP